MTVAEKIAHIRRINGYTQEQFAREIGVTRQSVYKWESGKAYPDIFRANAIIRLASITLEQLVNDSIELDEDGYAVRRRTHPRPAKKKRFSFFSRKNKLG